MKARVSTLAAVALAMLVAPPVLAQSASRAATAEPAAAKPGSPQLTAGATSPRRAAPIAPESSPLVLLADGIVANPARAQVHAPAPGFVYER